MTDKLYCKQFSARMPPQGAPTVSSQQSVVTLVELVETNGPIFIHIPSDP